MSDLRRTRLESALRRHYAAQRTTPAPDELVDGLARVMVAEDARARRAWGAKGGLVSFVMAQVRYLPVWTWLAQVAVVVLMVLVARGLTNEVAAKLVVGTLSAITVLIGVPTLHASRICGVVELEYACRHNVASVLIARMVVLGCSSALAVAVMVGLAASSIDASAFAVALWAAPPFFASCAGSLVLLRRLRPSSAPLACVAWVGACSTALVVVALRHPALYDSAATGVWAAAALVAFCWLVRETMRTVRAAAAGLDAFAPQLAGISL